MQNVENDRKGLREVKVNTFQAPTKIHVKPDVIVQPKINTKSSEEIEVLKQENSDLKEQINKLIFELAESKRITKLQKETNQLLLQKIKRQEQENSTVHIHSHKGIFWNDELN